MNTKIYTVDSFTDQPFKGNTCAVCFFPQYPNDKVLRNIAKQNLFAETAFIVPRDKANPELSWFTVSQEVGFCSNRTRSEVDGYLRHIAPEQSEVTFTTKRCGLLLVK